jgi:nucleotide-binding universal stress UspA family protein
MYRTIVVPLDGSSFAEAALGPARELAELQEATLNLVSVSTAENTRAYLEAVAASLHTTVSVTMADDVPSADPLGDVGASIAAAAAQPETLVCMATHGRGGVRRALLGSVTEAVVRSLSAPVMLVGPYVEHDRPIVGGNLLVCLDGSTRAEAILPAATAWARTFDMKPWLASVVNPDPSAARREVDFDVLESNYLARLAHDIERESGSVNWDVLHGTHPAPVLIDLAARLPAAVLACTTHGRTGVARLTLGSVAMDLAHGSPAPMLVERSV